ncbi:carbohydrate binding domain-containing protein [Ligilactobacillus salivarius]|uniref:carbohydrate binding domain-containing protein n=1 Tax=Ligilactobacillus salivarius TaxID=1624 RepID=UPI003994094C
MSYRIYNGTQLLGDVNNKSTGINGLLPATSYQLGVTNYNGNRESSKATINVKTRGIRLIIPTSLTVNSTITLNYQEYSLGLVPIGTEPAGMFGGGNKRNIQAKVISVDEDKSTVELLEPLESSSTVSIGNANLMRNTTRDYVKFTGNGSWSVDYLTPNHQAVDTPVEGGETYTFSAWVKNDSSSAGRIDLEIYQLNANGENKSNGSSSDVSVWVSPGEEKRLVFTKTLLADTTSVRLHTRNKDRNGIVTYWTKMAQVEKGTIATDWSPSPEDTQYIVDNTQMNKLQDGSFAAFNGYRAIYFRQ